MSGYACAGCGTVRPLFPTDDPAADGIALRCLGRIPFDPELARLCDRGRPITDMPSSNPVLVALDALGAGLTALLEEAR